MSTSAHKQTNSRRRQDAPDTPDRDRSQEAGERSASAAAAAGEAARGGQSAAAAEPSPRVNPPVVGAAIPRATDVGAVRRFRFEREPLSVAEEDRAQEYITHVLRLFAALPAGTHYEVGAFNQYVPPRRQSLLTRLWDAIPERWARDRHRMPAADPDDRGEERRADPDADRETVVQGKSTIIREALAVWAAMGRCDLDAALERVWFFDAGTVERRTASRSPTPPGAGAVPRVSSLGAVIRLRRQLGGSQYSTEQKNEVQGYVEEILPLLAEASDGRRREIARYHPDRPRARQSLLTLLWDRIPDAVARRRYMIPDSDGPLGADPWTEARAAQAAVDYPDGGPEVMKGKTLLLREAVAAWAEMGRCETDDNLKWVVLWRPAQVERRRRQEAEHAERRERRTQITDRAVESLRVPYLLFLRDGRPRSEAEVAVAFVPGLRRYIDDEAADACIDLLREASPNTAIPANTPERREFGRKYLLELAHRRLAKETLLAPWDSAKREVQVAPQAADDRYEVDPEFEALLPPLSPDELHQLADVLIRDGGSPEPVTVWVRDDGRKVLLDGHHRRRLLSLFSLPKPRIREVRLADRDEAVRWILGHQTGRRNLSKIGEAYMLGKRYELEKRKRGGTGANQYTQEEEESSAKRTSATARRLAAETGVGRSKVIQAANLAVRVDALETAVPGAKGLLLARGARVTHGDIRRLADLPVAEQRTQMEVLRAEGRLRFPVAGDRDGKTLTLALPASGPKAQADVLVQRLGTAKARRLVEALQARLKAGATA